MILIKGVTPIPYKIVTIASGVAHFSLPVFIVASIVTRGVRFYLVAACSIGSASRSVRSSSAA